MTWRLQVTHTTRYRYSAPVSQSYNEARLEPRRDRHQAVLASRVEVEPSTRVVRHVDATAKIAEEDRNPLRLAVQATRLRVCRSGVRTVTMRFLHLQRG